MNPNQPFTSQTNENGMSRSQSFDFSASQQSIQISNVIQCDPARLANFLGHCSQVNNKSNQKLETIYENLPAPQQIMSSNFQWNQSKEQQLFDNKIASIRGSVSSWNL
ncbi:unnamed protein product [Adineta ricciae]|uniref:Uncharacterized protein n=1 Tax=Adineta ricciae TaxID=249248 RepID=A0A813ZNC5_ADIRI|nr:unnamed protein product [Adineta ricciae]